MKSKHWLTIALCVAALGTEAVVLEWIGKSKVVNHHLDVPCHVLEKKWSHGGTDSGNMVIKGDNLLALKALLPRYAGKVKCIYIDPPYNTGNEGWCYNDNVNDPTIQRWLNKVVGKEGEDFTRHDKWLCMMYPRLKLLHQLLSEDGVIFISIDDNEQANLRLICDEIFGSPNYVATFSWVRKKKGAFLSKKVRKMTEFVLCYQKNYRVPLEMYGEAAYSDKWQPIVKRTNGAKILKFPCATVTTKLPNGVYEKGFRGKEGTGIELLTDIIVEEGLIKNEFDVRARFTWQQTYLDEEIKNGTKIDLSKQFGFNVLRHDQESKFKAPSTLITIENGVGTNEDATQELQDIFGGSPNEVFAYSKPHSLVAYLIKMIYEKRDKTTPFVVLDSFAGSGTTAHSALAIDSRGIQFILVELGDYAETLTAERVKRVIDGYGEGSKHVEGTGGAFSFYELGEPLMVDEELNEKVATEKIREYIYYTEVSKPLPDLGRAATKEPYLLGVEYDTAYYFCYEKGKVVTLDRELLRSVKTKADQYVVYADKCALSEAELRRRHITFKKIPRDITRL